MNLKPLLVYHNLDCFSQVDDTVLHHLTRFFRVIWYYEVDSFQKMRLGEVLAAEYASSNGIEIRIVNSKMRRRDLRNFLFYWKLAKEINSKNPNIVYSCYRYLPWAFAIKTCIKCKTVLGVHDAKAHSGTDKDIFGWLNKLSSRLGVGLFDKYVTFSSNQQKLFKERFGKDSAMIGMSCKHFGPSSMTPGNIEEETKLLFFGLILHYKGLDLLIDTMEQLTQRTNRKMTLTIAGKGPDWLFCESRIKTRSLYNLNIRFIENSEIPDLMSSHHFLVLPYRDATQSGPLFIAIAYGLPIIAPKYGCFTESYSENSALLYDSSALLSAIEKSASLTNSQYSNMKDACKTLQISFSEENIAANYINYFKSLL